jgi:stress response protein YsnF
MTHTVIGFFDNSNKAETAETQLIYNGFSREDVDISTRDLPENYEDYQGKKEDDDSIYNFFKSLFKDEEEEERSKYTEVGKRSCILTVHVDNIDEAEKAARIMDDYGAMDVNERAREFSGQSGFSGSQDTSSAKSSKTIPVIEEEMEVGKKEVENTGIRLRSRIIEKPVEKHLRLRSEHINVERHKVNRPATESELENFKEGTYEARERKEVPLVNKKAKVVEEVQVNKEVEEHDETIRGKVRKTDVDIENLEEEEEHYHHFDENDRKR